MQKVIDFLEQKCQWLAVGLGALFALFMVYSYVLQPPAKVVIGQDTLTSGEVDPYILEHVAKPLDDATTASGTISLPVPKYVQTLMNAMNWTGVKPVDFTGGFPVLPPLPDTAIAGSTTPGVPGVPGPNNLPNIAKVKTLPVPPPVIMAESKFGRSVIMPSVAGQPPAAVQPPQPGQPTVAGIDKDWVTQLFHIDVKAIQAAFVAAQIPDKFHTTLLLQVEMQREEVDDNGAAIPGTQQIIAPLDSWRSSVAPPPFPPEDARDQQGPYLQWAAQNTADILEPLFYTVLKGDQWAKPGAQAAAIAVFDPATFKGDLNTLSADQKAAVMKARQEADKAARDAKKAAHPPKQSTPAGGAPPGIGAGFSGYVPPQPNYAPAPGSHAPAHPATPAHPPAAAVGRGINIVDGPPGMEGAAGGMYPGSGTAGVTPASLPQPGTDFPAGEFDPNDPKWSTKTLEGWCHDQTVVANKTYHYRIRYKLKNPVLGAGNVTEPPELSNAFAITAPWSDWGSAITIPPLINFFVAGNRSPNGSSVRFEVFKWEQGEQRSASFAVSEGDEVGGVDPKSGVDFATGWSVVDFRSDSRLGGSETQILLVNDQTGKIVARSYSTDRNDQLYKGLKDQVTAAKALAAAAGAPGGAPPVIR